MASAELEMSGEIPATGIIDSWAEFFAYTSLGTMIADGIFQGRLPNSQFLTQMLDINPANLNEALRRLSEEGVITNFREQRLMGESAGEIAAGRAPLNHRAYSPNPEEEA